MKRKRYALVYQCGIANVFRMRADGPRSVMQHAYLCCEHFSRGLVEAGAALSVHHCDMVGDINDPEQWADGPGDLWRDKKNPPRRQVISVF